MKNTLGHAAMGARLARLSLALTLAALSLQAHATRVVADETGRQVQVPDHPHRIISLVPSVTDALYSIGAGDDVVGISDYVKYPAEAMKKPSVGTILTPSFEAIVALHPDLLLAIKTETGAGSVEKFRQLGIPIFLVDPHGIEGIFRSILALGDAVNRRPQAEAEVAHLRQRVAAVHAQVQGKPIVSIFLPIWHDPVITIGKGSFITEMIEVAGGRSVTSDITQEWPQISIEAVLARAPEALLLKRDGRITLDMLKDRPGWRAIPAVTQARVFYLDNRMDFASPVAIDALEDLARQLHP